MVPLEDLVSLFNITETKTRECTIYLRTDRKNFYDSCYVQECMDGKTLKGCRWALLQNVSNLIQPSDYRTKIATHKVMQRFYHSEYKLAKMQKKNLDSADETRSFEKGKIQLATFDDVTIGRGILEPGWSWEKCVKPIVNTKSCEAPHTQYIISGRMHVKMDDGSEEEFGRGDAAIIPPGHNAWVVGNEPVVAIDFTGLKEYAKKS